MKTFSLILVSILTCVSSVSFAYIPKGQLILQKMTDNAGSGVYQVDQEVQFPNGNETLVLKETWLVDNENNMKVIVTGAKELKDLVAFAVTFQGGNRVVGGSPKKLGDDFIERYFHSRNAEALAQHMIQMKMASPQLLVKKPIRTLKDADNQPENFVRLSRVGGVFAYAFGVPSLPEQSAPGMWVEQDQFVLRKIRLPSQAEVSADRYTSYSRGLSFPKTRVVRWDNNQVTIQTISVTAKGREAWASFGLKAPAKMDGLANQPAASLVEDFYKRFR